MKAQIKAASAYEVEIGGTSLGFFRQVSEWEGLAKLQNEAGEALIIVLPAGGMSRVFSEIFGGAAEATVIMASPGLHLPPVGVMQAAGGAS